MAQALFEKPVRNPSGWEEVSRMFVHSESAKMRTMIPAKVLEVDYETSTVMAQPLIRTWWEKYRSEVSMWPVVEVPIIFQSAKRGGARMTFPVKKGDIGLLFFCDRHTEIYMGSDGEEVVDSGSMSAMGMDGFVNVIGFIPELFNKTKKVPFDAENISLTHDKSKITLSEEGDIVSGNDKITSELKADGSGSITNGVGTISLLADGNINLNGVIIRPDGTIIAPKVQATTVEAATSLKKGGIELNAP